MVLTLEQTEAYPERGDGYCIRCGVEDCYEANIDEHGFCSGCVCDFINQAREFRKQMDFLGVIDIYILMAEFAAYKVAEAKKNG